MSSTVIGELYLSNNGQYLINNEKIYFALENKSYSLNEISLSKWIDILSENTAFSLKHNLVEVKELASYHRKITYQIFESLSFDAKSMLMLEYEMKFGNILLTESVNLSESFFSDSSIILICQICGGFNLHINIQIFIIFIINYY